MRDYSAGEKRHYDESKAPWCDHGEAEKTRSVWPCPFVEEAEELAEQTELNECRREVQVDVQNIEQLQVRPHLSHC